MSLVISNDKSKLDIELIHRFLSTDAYWSPGIPRATVQRAVDHSLCFGAFDDAEQIGFARVITDCATFAYVADVFVVSSRRGQGVSTAIMAAIAGHADLQGLRRWHLVTRDAHGLYAKFGFRPLEKAERHLEKVAPRR